MKQLLTVLFLASMALSTTACSGGGKCEKAIDKAMGFAKEMMEGLAGMAGGDADKMKAEMEKQMAEAKVEGVKACKEALAKDKENTEKALDCIIAASKMEDLEKCEGAKGLMGSMK